MGLLKALHLIGVAYFLGFLMLDAFLIRRFLDDKCHDKKLAFYENAKYSLYFAAAVIVISGVLLAAFVGFYLPAHIWLKIVFGLTSLTLFFLSPSLIKPLPRGSVHYVYAALLLLALAVVFLAKS